MHKSQQQFLLAGNFGHSASILSQFTILQPKNRKISLKPPYFRVKGHSRLLVLTALKSMLPVLVIR